MNFSASDIKKALADKGFKKGEGSNHTSYIFMYNGKKTSVKTFSSRGSKHKDISNSLPKLIAEQCLLCNKCFKRFVDGNMSKANYINHLKMLDARGNFGLLPRSSNSPAVSTAILCEDCYSKALKVKGRNRNAKADS